jgi:hypothetical protein
MYCSVGVVGVVTTSASILMQNVQGTFLEKKRVVIHIVLYSIGMYVDLTIQPVDRLYVTWCTTITVP